MAQIQPNGTAHGLREDAERVRTMGAQSAFPDVRQRPPRQFGLGNELAPANPAGIATAAPSGISVPLSGGSSRQVSVFGWAMAAPGVVVVPLSTGSLPSFARRQEPRPKGVIDAFVKTCQRWQLTEREQLVLLGYQDNEFFGTQILNGLWLKAPQDVRDRTGYVLGISMGLGAIFNENVQAELAWLNSAHPKLANRSPMRVMLEGRMKSLMAVSALVADERGLR